ncbi:hypothetical protein J3E69DRAFT_339760 [Trichoderma sp. SZMC 28015]
MVMLRPVPASRKQGVHSGLLHLWLAFICWAMSFVKMFYPFAFRCTTRVALLGEGNRATRVIEGSDKRIISRITQS